MKKSVYKIIIMIIACAFVIVGILVSVNLVNTRNMTINQAEKSLHYMCETYANEFNTIFSDSELIVKNMASVIEKDYVVDEYINNRDHFTELYDETSKLFEEAITNSNYPVGLYVTFNPETSKGQDEVWYVKKENGEIFFVDSVPLSEGWLIEEDSTTAYYFRTIREGEVWFEASYDPGMDGEVITYAKALYDINGELIGVIGIDIVVDDIFNTLGVIDKEIHGYSAFIDNNKSLVAGADIEKYQSSREHIIAEAAIGDKWTIALVQPIKMVTESIAKTEITIILLGILIIITVIVLIIAYSHRKVHPIIREVETKDLIMINQARQAKMGEAVGNIAHQWKQPLNSMKMALSNIQEDYEQDCLGEEDFHNYIERMKLMVNRLTETADDFITFLKPGKKPEVFSVNNEIHTVLNLMEERLRIRSVTVNVEGEEVYIKGYKNEFNQCMFNLLDNAGDAMMDADIKDRTVVITTTQEDDYNLVKVFNKGNHIKDAYKDKIFDLYFTTKDSEDGSGIGLYMTKEIIKEHFHGEMYFENVPGGVTFIMKIPAQKEGNAI